jgi:hypothetical protein
MANHLNINQADYYFDLIKIAFTKMPPDNSRGIFISWVSVSNCDK